MSQPPPASGPARGAVIAGVVCYGLWGLLPLYLQAVPPRAPRPWR